MGCCRCESGIIEDAPDRPCARLGDNPRKFPFLLFGEEGSDFKGGLARSGRQLAHLWTKNRDGQVGGEEMAQCLDTVHVVVVGVAGASKHHRGRSIRIIKFAVTRLGRAGSETKLDLWNE